MSRSAESAPKKTSGPVPGTTAGLETVTEWRALLSRYSHIVLVANSDECQLESLVATLPDTALFVFFNKVYKVLRRPFAGNALLVARSSAAGANIVYRREVGDVLRFFEGANFQGILNIRAHHEERLSAAAEFGVPNVGHLDLAGYFSGFYPQGRMPTSGFALAIWLCELDIGRPVILTGFSARRSEKWKLFHQHDWTFEQVLLRLFVRLGKLQASDTAELCPYAVLQQRFPDIKPADIALSAAEVLSERLDGANHEIDRLISLTKFNRAIQNFTRWLKPKTRKQKLAEKNLREAAQGGSPALADRRNGLDDVSPIGDVAESHGFGKK
ncbi:3-deoxy-manno-octulosonate cytidylyltransferase [Rhizobiaceae bacterium n13]|uniref:3-deoxy-manno-octulosonate cytidylyltransferase n=1 Tax=Ferirhizobium litorale TaxID=2927786 RepID=A0AAE3QG52_9HYPH|nr:3-deoxy-manno-octulosonate cytidylyltransferase [Fererhizobium litorale]MDI7865289.1 3-deoxy-manno-octulosonate cytidylyltransferase [Fererhizobium litorale]MDI7925192.1 3-deoxy-manno-octulosonate cytidylyltransferase [Fererhizobium litorale]